jgi:IS605 OrfB family transposase
MPSKLSTQNDVHGQVENTVACTFKIKIPDTLAHRLNSLLLDVSPCVECMLRNRSESSSKYYPEIPCVVSKSLIAKYQRNRKCRSVSNLVIPICGDKERQIKVEGVGVRTPALFQKEILPLTLFHPCVADKDARHNISAEFFMRGGEWYGAFSYNTPAAAKFQPTGVVGVDRNSMGHVATKLQRQGKTRLLCKIKRKQSRRRKHENHIVSKAIVDYAATHRRAIVLENLEGIRAKGSKIRSYTERSQWSFFQLNQYIQYKAALRGVEVLYIGAAHTSQECSRCHSINKPAGKKYTCANCGHNDHRDANAVFSIAQKGIAALRNLRTDGIARYSEEPRSGLMMPAGGRCPFLVVSGKHWRVFRAGEADDMPVSKRNSWEDAGNPRVHSGSINDPTL